MSFGVTVGTADAGGFSVSDVPQVDGNGEDFDSVLRGQLADGTNPALGLGMVAYTFGLNYPSWSAGNYLNRLQNAASYLDGASLVGYSYSQVYPDGTVGGDLRTKGRVVSSIAELRALLKTNVPWAFVTGYYAPNDGGGGNYWLDTSDTSSSDNGGSIIVATDGGRWKLLLSSNVDVRQFGARAGVESTTAIQAAVNSGARRVYGAGLTFICSVTLALAGNQELDDIKLSYVAATGLTTLVTATGVQGANVNLTADGTIRTRTVPVATAGVAVDQWFYIGSTAAWDTDGTTTGELNQVKSIDSSAQLTCKVPLSDTYASASTAFVAPLTPITGVRLRKVEIIGSGPGFAQLGLQLTYAQGVRMEDCTVRDADQAAVTLTRCQDVRAVRCALKHATRSGFAYGFVIERACRDIDIDGNRMEYMRHGLTIGGGEGVSDGVRVRGNGIWYCTDAGLDSHGASRGAKFVDNDVWCAGSADSGGNSDGIVMQGADGTIEDNRVWSPRGTGIWAQSTVLRGTPGVKIINNLVDSSGAGNNPGIFVEGDLSAAGWFGAVVSNNRVTNTLASSNPAIYVYANAAPVQDATVTSNVVEGASSFGMIVRGVTRGTVGDNSVVIGSSANGDGILVQACTDMAVGDNAVKIGGTTRSCIQLLDTLYSTVNDNTLELPASSTGNGINLNASGSGNTNGVTVSGNTVKSPTPVSSRGLVISTFALNTRVGYDNYFEECSTPISWGSGTGNKGGMVYGSATYDPPSLAGGAVQQTTVSAPGAFIGDIARASFSINNAGISWSAEVTSTDTVTVTQRNLTGGAIDQGSGTLKVSVARH